MKADDEFLKLQKRIEQELTKIFRIRYIVKTSINYFGIGRKNLINNKNKLAPVAYARHIISYIGYGVYGIDISIVAKNIKSSRHVVYYGYLKIKDNINSDQKIFNDVNLIRQQLNEIFNVKKNNT